MIEKSCGTIPYTKINGEINYLLVRAKDDGYCGFPKGHVEEGETEIDTALRETLEETSLTVTVTEGFRYETSFTLDNGNQKTVIYFTATFGDQTPVRNGEFEDLEYLLLPFGEARAALTYDNAKEMLQAADTFLKQLPNA